MLQAFVLIVVHDVVRLEFVLDLAVLGSTRCLHHSLLYRTKVVVFNVLTVNFLKSK